MSRNPSNPSTITVVVYTNVHFDRRNLYFALPCLRPDQIEHKLTKNGNVKKDSVKSDYGTIITKMYGDENSKKVKSKLFEGLNLNKSGRMFPGQLSVRIYLNNHWIHIMLFPLSMTLTGCRSIEEAMEVVMIFWEEYVYNTDTWNVPDNSDPKFWFIPHMQNYNQNIGYPINKMALNDLLNSPEYSDTIYESVYNNELDIRVRVSMYYSSDPDMHKTLIFPKDKKPYTTKSSLPEEYGRKDKDESPFITFSIFPTSSVTESGRIKKDIDKCHKFLMHLTKKHRNVLEEKV